MYFNYAKERKKFEIKWEKLRKEYLEAGMHAEDIEIMYKLDLDVFNSNRRYINHYEDFDFANDKNKGFYKIANAEFSCEIYLEMNWVEELESDDLYEKITQLSMSDLELLTLYVFEQQTQTEIGRRYGISQKNISKKIKRIRKFLQGN
ncbi:MAG: sigma-70 family RNA polymerase sigma factor [Clostridia bacterium]